MEAGWEKRMLHSTDMNVMVMGYAHLLGLIVFPAFDSANGLNSLIRRAMATMCQRIV